MQNLELTLLENKILRDWREFYRILWEVRFPQSDIYNNESNEVLLKKLFKCLNINSEFATNQASLYMRFFGRYTKIPYKIKAPKSRGYRHPKDVLSVFKNYSVIERDKFITHPVFSKLFLLLFFMLLPVYLQKMKQEFQEVVTNELVYILNRLTNEWLHGGPYGAGISRETFCLSQKFLRD